jgi:phosphomannomutase
MVLQPRSAPRAFAVSSGRAHAGADRELRLRSGRCGGSVVIGRDTRRSSPAFRAAVVSGFSRPAPGSSTRGEPSPWCPSPSANRARGIAITGSHNDASWNALKFFGPDGAQLNAAKNGELLDVYHGAAFDFRPGIA